MLWLGFFELSLKPFIICHRVILKLKFCFFEQLFQFQSADLEGQPNFYRESNDFHIKSKTIKVLSCKNFANLSDPPLKYVSSRL